MCHSLFGKGTINVIPWPKLFTKNLIRFQSSLSSCIYNDMMELDWLDPVLLAGFLASNDISCLQQPLRCAISPRP